MKGKSLVVMAIALGVVAVVLVNAQFHDMEAKEPPPRRTFYRANADILPGVTVRAAPDDTHVLAPVVGVPEGFAKGYPDAVDTEIQWAKPLTIARPIHAGEFLTMTHLHPPPPVDVPARLPSGHAAISIPVGPESSAGSLVATGDVVDIYLLETKNTPRVPGGVEVVPVKVASDITIWSIDGMAGTGDGASSRSRGTQSSSVTVSAPPEVIERLMVARQQGRLSLVLKSKKGS